MVLMIFMISLLSIIVLILSSSMILINTIISKKSFNDREKSSPFECGFDPSSSPRMPFSLHFFMITVIFLVFDVEITLLIPMIKTMEISNLSSYFWTFSIFILILVSGTLHEWNQGALSWKS